MSGLEAPETTNHRARILVADDFLPWRVQVRQLLRARPDWQIVCEVGDGLAAVQKTAELRPDVVLLDVGMPVLNGIEAAKQIRQISLPPKIVFLTGNGGKEVRNAALETGAEGYVLKTAALRELLDCIAAALGDGHSR